MSEHVTPEAERLEVLRALNLHSVEPHSALENFREAAQRIADTAGAVISVIDDRLVHYLSGRVSSHDPQYAGCSRDARNSSAERAETLCYATLRGGDMVIPDVARWIAGSGGDLYSPELRDMVRELDGFPVTVVSGGPDGEPVRVGFKFYAGAVVETFGHRIGTLCVMDDRPRPDFSEAQFEMLRRLARLVGEYFEDHSVRRPGQMRLLERLGSSAPPASDQFDVVVLGGGPAGSAAACRLSFYGLSVALVEPNQRFGAPTGVTSKCLREAALEFVGRRTTGPPEVEWSEVLALRERILTHEAARVRTTLDAYGVTIVRGWGRLGDGLSARPNRADEPIEVTVDRAEDGGRQVLRTRYLVIATGSSAQRLPGIPYDGRLIFDADQIAGLDRLPRSVVVQGAGVVAVEYAQIFARFGARVTMIVRGGPISFLKQMDFSIARAVVSSLEKAGVEIVYQAIPDLVEPTEDRKGVRVVLGRGQELTAELFLSAVGRVSVSGQLGLERLGIDSESAASAEGRADGSYRLQTADARLRDRVFAIGDVAGPPGLASTAVFQAQAAAGCIIPDCRLGRQVPLEEQVYGSVIWTVPEMACVGKSEEEAKVELGDDRVGVSVASFASTVKGTVAGIDESYFLKLVFDAENGVVLGVHLFGEGSAELVHYGASLIQQRLTVFDLMHSVFAAVTLHEVFRVAATGAIESLAARSGQCDPERWSRVRRCHEAIRESTVT